MRVKPWPPPGSHFRTLSCLHPSTISEQLIEDTVALTVRGHLQHGRRCERRKPGDGSKPRMCLSFVVTLSAGSQRDGLPDTLFSSTGGFDYSLIERVEIVKGPSGILYATIPREGVVNLVSKKPLAEAATKLVLAIGDHNMYRGEIDTSNFFDADKKMGYRLSASYYDYDGVTDAPQDAEKDGRLAINPSILYRGDEGVPVLALVSGLFVMKPIA